MAAEQRVESIISTANGLVALAAEAVHFSYVATRTRRPLSLCHVRCAVLGVDMGVI